MTNVFERAEKLLGRIGKKPWLIISDSPLHPGEDRIEPVFHGIEALCRALNYVVDDQLTDDELARRTDTERENLRRAAGYMSACADPLRKLGEAPHDNDPGFRSGLQGFLYIASGNALNVASMVDKISRYDDQDLANVTDLAVATIRAFVAYKPVCDHFSAGYPANQAQAGLDAIERSLAPYKVGQVLPEIMELLGLEHGGHGRYITATILREQMANPYAHPSIQVAALAALMGLWLEKADWVEALGNSGNRYMARQRSILDHTGDKLQELAQWLAEQGPGWTVDEHHRGLLHKAAAINLRFHGL